MNPYTRGYFEDAEGSHYHGYEDWPQFKQRAEWIVKTYNPECVVELGAAKGFLLKHLKSLGIKTVGYDVSEHAVKESEGRVTLLDATTGLWVFHPGDLVVSFDFLEHIKEKDLHQLLCGLRGAERQFHMITTSEYDFGGDTTHYTSKPKEWWIDKFEQYGVRNYKIIHAGEQEETFK